MAKSRKNRGNKVRKMNKRKYTLKNIKGGSNGNTLRRAALAGSMLKHSLSKPSASKENREKLFEFMSRLHNEYNLRHELIDSLKYQNSLGYNAMRPKNSINVSPIGRKLNSNDSMKDARRIWEEYINSVRNQNRNKAAELRYLANKKHSRSLSPSQQKRVGNLRNFRRSQMKRGIRMVNSPRFIIDPITDKIIPISQSSILELLPTKTAYIKVPKLKLSNIDSSSKMNYKSKSKLLLGKSSSNKHKSRFKKMLSPLRVRLRLSKKKGDKSVNINV